MVFVLLCAASLVLGFVLRSEVPVEGLTIDEADMLSEMFSYINGHPLAIHIVNANLSLPLFLYAPVIQRVSIPYKIQRLIFCIEIAVGQSMIICAAYVLFGVYGLWISGLTLAASRIGLAPHLLPHGTTRLFLPIGGFLLVFAFLARSDVVKKWHLVGGSLLMGVVIFWAMFSYPGGRPLIGTAVLVCVYLLVSRKTGVCGAICALLLCFLVAYLLGLGYASLCVDGGTTFGERMRVVSRVYFRHTGWGRYVPVSQYWPNAVALYHQFFDPSRDDYAAPSNLISAVRAMALPWYVVPLAAAILCAMLVDLCMLLFAKTCPSYLRGRFVRDLFLLLFIPVGVLPAIVSDQPVLRRSLVGIASLILFSARPIVTWRRFPFVRNLCSCGVAALVLVSAVHTGGNLRGEYFAHVPYHRAGPTKRMYELVWALMEHGDIEIIFIPDHNPYSFTCYYADPAFAAMLDGKIVPWAMVSRHVAGLKGKTVVGIICENNNLSDFEEKYGLPGVDGFACNIGRQINSDRGVATWNDFAVACWGDECDFVESLLPQPQSLTPFPTEPNI